MKHTPAPWDISTYDGEFGVYSSVRPENNDIALVRSSFNETENQANARLIAAAPELLEALEHLVKITYDYGDTRDRNSPVHDALKQASDAITKATLSTVTN